MTEQQKPILLVAVNREPQFGPNPAEWSNQGGPGDQLIELANSVQSLVHFFPHEADEGPQGIVVSFGDRNVAGEYMTRENRIFIDSFVYESHRIRVPIHFYLCYCTGLGLLELLVEQRLGLTAKFKREEGSQINQDVWEGRFPGDSTRLLDKLKSVGEETQLLTDDVLRLVRCAWRLDRELSDSVGLLVERLGLKGHDYGDGVHRSLLAALRDADQTRIPPVVNAVLSHEDDASAQLANLLADTATPHAYAALQQLLQSVRLPVKIGDRMAEALEYGAASADQLRRSNLPLPEQQPRTPNHDAVPSAATTGNFGFQRDTTIPQDSLNYNAYAEALASVISSPETETPITLGICAPWGRGKTVLMNYIMKRIKETGDRATRKETTRPSIVWFDAWKYSHASDLRAGFAAAVMQDLESKLSLPRRLQLAITLNWPSKRNVILRFLLFLVPAAALTYLATLAVLAITQLGLWWSLLVALPVVGAALWRLYRSSLKALWQASQHPISEHVVQLISLPDYTARLSEDTGVLRDLQVAVDLFQRWNKVDRIYVFIDDIDRCPPDKILEVFEGMKHLLDMKGFVFTIGMDARVVRCAIGEHYAFMGENAFEKEDMGRSYLEKLIQIPFHLPHVESEKLGGMLRDLVANYSERDADVHQTGTTPVSDEAGKPTAEQEFRRQVTSDTKDESPAPATANPIAQEPEKVWPKEVTAPGTRSLERPDLGNKLLLATTEIQLLNEIVSSPSFSISPRILKRLVNTYLIARHLYIATQEAGEKDVAVPSAPPPDFTKWLALSVAYPFQARALQRGIRADRGDGPQEWIFPISANGRFQLTQRSEDGAIGSIAGTPFEGMSRGDLDCFAAAYTGLRIIDPECIPEYSKYTDCFNFVLD